ncbi:MAG: hypothetical protein QOI66_2029 [Myxococcales bacterium]|jgi:hypothetical protein|nr:hypothetical protein [Myxococcales bacterium]
MTRQITILVSSIAMASCSPGFFYRPADNATATMKGRVAADYQIPPNAPRGDVRLASFGIGKISMSGSSNQKQKAVHVRMIVTDNSQTPWTMDMRQQAIALPDGQQLAPAYASTHEGQNGLPSVTVPARGKRIIDLFYGLPANIQLASQLPSFSVVWHVNMSQQQVTERTRFDRMRVEPATVPSGERHASDIGWAGGEARSERFEWYEVRR